MNVHDAIDRACSAVGIKPPRSYKPGGWATCDTLDGKSGKGDGRVLVDDLKVIGWNWKTGEKATIWIKDRHELSEVEKRQFAERKARDEAEKARKAEEAAAKAARIVDAAKLSTHPYFAAKGFPVEKGLVLGAVEIRKIAGEYVIAGDRALVMPARVGKRIVSVQLIWEDGAKKFLAGGEIKGACHRIATGRDTWLCEGYATGLSLRAALKSLNRVDTVLCCFSASNVAEVARRIQGRCYIAADHDKPMPQFDGLGTGEHWARVAGKPYVLPPEIGDINDYHMSHGIFAVQKLLAQAIRRSF